MTTEEFIMPDDILVAETHEYIRLLDDERAQVGITEYAAGQLGDVVFVELPEIGQSFEKGESFGSIESVKAQSDLYLPVAGEVVGVNAQLADEPGSVNDAPYGAGWLVEILLSNPDEAKQLMSPSDYRSFVEDLH